MASSSRFADPVSDQKQKERRSKAVPGKTKATTDWGIKAWTDWACSRVITPGDVGVVSRVLPTTPLLDMPPGDLAYWMGKFVLEVRKHNGDEYPPKSAMVCCFKRFYNQNERYDINPLCSTDEIFGNFRSTLDAEMKRLHGSGLGTSSKQAEPISPDEEAMLWSSGQFGAHNGKASLNTVYYYNCKIFGLRSYDEHRNLKRTQFFKKVDEKVVFISNMLISETSRIGVDSNISKLTIK